jgi:Holliday junction resolvasome RuvABC endonuclease subunit
MRVTSSKLKVVGHDPSLRNWGLATGTYDLETNQLEVDWIGLVQPVIPTGKQVRQNSVDLEAASQLYKGAWEAVKGAQVVFVEVPVGSQSSRAMASYGVCVGVLGALRAGGTSFFEVTPTEVKLASVGSKTATKREMINWAYSKHKHLAWPVYAHKGATLIAESKAEHQADAVATLYAGISLQSFQQLLQVSK